MALIISCVCFQLAIKTRKLQCLAKSKAFNIYLKPQLISACSMRYYSKDSLAELGIEAEELEFDEDIEEKEKEIQRKQNKSRLNKYHRNILNDQAPYKEPLAWYHHSISYKKRSLGRYGFENQDIPLGILWPTKEELADRIDYEKHLRPDDLQTMVQRVTKKRRAEEAEDAERQILIEKNMAKLELWKKEYKDRLAKKEKEAKIAVEKKERIVEEVRRHFGYMVDPRDDKFKEMLELKEKEEKKLEKEARKKAKQAKMLERLAKMSKEETNKTAETESVETKPAT